MNTQPINITTVGDISFRGRYENATDRQVFADVNNIFSGSNFVIGNLESPFTQPSATGLPGKCNLRGNPDWAVELKNSGIDLVTLANNHMMDFGIDGLTTTLNALNEAGILAVGAGMDIYAACKPAICTINDRHVAIFGRCSVEVSSPCYATHEQPGVAFLDLDELKLSIAKVRDEVDKIILLVHWGMEHYSYPTPQQRDTAASIISLGTDFIFGHHPHVVQGHEFVNGGLVSYSSGNFIFDDFTWNFKNPDGETIELDSVMTDQNREGLILQVNINSDDDHEPKAFFTCIDANCRLTIDDNSSRHHHYRKLSKRLDLPFYNTLWFIYSLKREWDLRLRHMFSPIEIVKNIHKIRFRHIKTLFTAVRRSSKISSGKSTNPYEG
ncbi:MAG: CapA family protein [Candidatus Thiodiazotropha sp.]